VYVAMNAHMLNGLYSRLPSEYFQYVAIITRSKQPLKGLGCLAIVSSVICPENPEATSSEKISRLGSGLCWSSVNHIVDSTQNAIHAFLQSGGGRFSP
jgi:hypothetical protein